MINLQVDDFIFWGRGKGEKEKGETHELRITNYSPALRRNRSTDWREKSKFCSRWRFRISRADCAKVSAYEYIGVNLS
ncbi:hypothetical protein H6G04_25560 [Calothrix membranacea FACHB-236]|nr:hypothetical protein [Calothrix membranacea FACHB-236]